MTKFFFLKRIYFKYQYLAKILSKFSLNQNDVLAFFNFCHFEHQGNNLDTVLIPTRFYKSARLICIKPLISSDITIEDSCLKKTLIYSASVEKYGNMIFCNY